MQKRNGSLRSGLQARGRGAVEDRAIAELKLDPCNARIHTPAQIRQIAQSIETFDFNVPVLVDSELKVIAGHGRILACQRLGWTEAPTIRLDPLIEAHG